MRYHRTTGLRISQVQELVARVQDRLEEPWNKKDGRPRSCGLYRAVDCMYVRQNATEEFLGDVHGISQPTVSRFVVMLVPVIKSALEEFVPSAEAIEMVQGRVCLVDGTIPPCRSYEDHKELWSWKHARDRVRCATGQPPGWHADLCVRSARGKTHDKTAFDETRLPRSSATPAAESVTRVTRERPSLPPSESRKVESSAKEIKTATLSYPGSGRPSKRVVAHIKTGASSIPTTAAATPTTETSTTPSADYSR